MKIDESKSKLIKNSIILMTSTLLFVITFILVKSNILLISGITILILLYLLINIMLINIYFQRKMTMLKLWIFTFLDLSYFLLGTFSLSTIILFFAIIFLLSKSIIKYEGRDETSRVLEYMGMYIIIKIIFAMTLMLV